MIWLLVIPALAAVFVAGAAARALILTATRHGRHVREFDRDLAKACGYEAGDGSLAAELRALPAPGKDYISDRTVVLPRTPPLRPPSRQPTEAELDEFKDRWTAAQDWLPAEAPGPAAWQPPEHALRAVSKRYPAPAGVDAGVDADVEEWQHILAPAERLASDTDIRSVTPPADDTFVSALLSLPVERVHEAFTTGQFPAVTA